MKKTELKMMIRKIVREEVAMAIHEVITELKQPTKQLTSDLRPRKVIKKKMVEKKKYSDNSVLNDILNETAQDSDWKTVGGGAYTSDRAHELIGSQYSDLNSNRPVSADNMVASLGVNPDSVPEEVKDNMFNKDYSSLIKKSIEISKRKNGG